MGQLQELIEKRDALIEKMESPGFRDCDGSAMQCLCELEYQIEDYCEPEPYVPVTDEQRRALDAIPDRFTTKNLFPDHEEN